MRASLTSLPPVWLMGFCNILQGVNGAVMLVAVPQILSAKGVPEPSISVVVAVGLVPSFSSFLLSPLLDWRLSRRTYAIGLAVLAAVLQFAALFAMNHLAVLTVLLFLAYSAVMLYVAAIGGWLADLTDPAQKAGLGAWLTVWNVGGGGIVAMAAASLLRELPLAVGAAILSLLLLTPLLLFPWLPSRDADRRLASQSFRAFTCDLVELLRRPAVRETLFLFLLPVASFTLTNTLAGLGADFGASEAIVSLAGGAGIAIAGLIGSLVVPPLLRRIPARWGYLLIGSAGAGFTLTLIAAPRIPAIFTLSMVGENAFQAAAFAVEGAIILRAVGNDNPLAATQFALLNAASSLPIIYMQVIDGQAYGHGGLSGSCLADAGFSLLACGALALYLRSRTARHAEPVPVP